jgi:hypothetical protein
MVNLASPQLIDIIAQPQVESHVLDANDPVRAVLRTRSRQRERETMAQRDPSLPFPTPLRDVPKRGLGRARAYSGQLRVMHCDDFIPTQYIVGELAQLDFLNPVKYALPPRDVVG